ncbi:uncharacterized protein LOC115400030 [Salarias fasciatus]|uniref:uncharacterized protein LOC115400030 n=1 Tax=Salarias fasciatus TaxID=181472 RepID=UPI00117702B4|nr:uncharacterized protein LOC115400030 [Salarias fasciatus]
MATASSASGKGKDVESRPCPASCGFTISGRDPHPLCITCMGVQHAQASLADSECCQHCSTMPTRILERRLRVSASSKADPSLSDSAAKPKRAIANLDWANPPVEDFPPLFDQLLDSEDEHGGGHEEEDDNMDLLNDDNEEDDEDAILPPTPASRPSSSVSGGIQPPSSPSEVDLHEVCKRAASRLGIDWPASQDDKGEERDLYDGKILPSRPVSKKQVMPVVPACMKEMKRFWDKPFRHRVPVKGYSGLEVANSGEWGLGDPPVVEQAVASHLHPSHRSALTAAGPTLPGKMERFSASMFQKMYKSAAQSVNNLNVVTLLTAYQAELFQEMGVLLDKGSPSPKIWEEMCVVTDLILRVSRGAVQGCGRVMGLAVAGERALWLNLSSLSDQEKQVIIDAPFDPSRAKGLFGEAVTAMQQTSDLRKKQGEAFDLCLPRKVASRPTPPPRQGFAAAARARSSGYKDPRPRTSEQPASHQRGAQQQKHWPRKSFASAAAAPGTGPTRPSRPPGREEKTVGLGVVVRRHRGSAVSTCRDPCSEPLRNRLNYALVPPVHSFVSPLRRPTGTVLREVERSAMFTPSTSPGFSIKNKLSQPGSVIKPRAQRTQNKKKNQEVQDSLSPLEGAAAPLLSFRPPGPLAVKAEEWRACAVNPWVFTTVARGYRLQFAVRPPRFNGVLTSEAAGEAAEALESEISSLLSRGAIRLVPEGERNQGFYSRYFLIPKKGGSLRPILDLRFLNLHLRKYKFKMLTHKVLFRSIHPGDWFTSVDLQDAYFHISIYPAHRKYLRFAFKGTAYEYQTLPFGLSLAPRVFSKCVEAALNPMRASGFRVFAYLDDFLLCASSKEKSERDTRKLMDRLYSLGFNINPVKSCLSPTQRIEYLGLEIDSVSFRGFLSHARVKKFRQHLALFRRGRSVSLRDCLRLSGLMASSISVIPHGLLKMRDFQRWISSLRLDARRHLRRMVRVSPECLLALRHWRDPGIFSTGVPLGAVVMRKTVTTDASLTGWGAVFGRRSVNGTWPPTLRQAHINYLELLAVFLALRHFLPLLGKCHVLVRADNTTAVAYINREGGTRSVKLHRLAQSLLLWSSEHLLSLRAAHLPGALNSGADLLSRGNPLYGEWRLNPEVLLRVWERFGRASVDLFASHENAQCPLFFSLRDRDAPLGADAFAHPWPNALLYAFPPLYLITPTLIRVKEQQLSLILIAPYWPSRPWMAELIQLVHGQPWPLPLRTDLVSQACGQVFHPNPERLALWAWFVRG